MHTQETFKMTYSAQQQAEVQAIRQKYLPREMSKLERLRRLDASVQKKAAKVSILAGTLGTLLFGVGMSLCLSELGNVFGAAGFPVGIGTGLVGLALLAWAYPLHQRTLRKERARIAPEVLRLTDELSQ